MAASSTATLVRIKRSGMGVIAPTAGLAALAAILAPAGPLNAQVPELLPNLIARVCLCWQDLITIFCLAGAPITVITSPDNSLPTPLIRRPWQIRSTGGYCLREPSRFHLPSRNMPQKLLKLPRQPQLPEWQLPQPATPQPRHPQLRAARSRQSLSICESSRRPELQS